jgi:DNA replication protein DnaC
MVGNMYHRDSNFWELGDYAEAHLSKLQMPDEICNKINEWWKNPSNFLVFLGNPGCGKTYLIAALIHGLIEKKIKWFKYLHEKDFYSKMRKTIDAGFDYEYEIRTICEAPWVFMDDIHSTQSTEFQKECLLSFVDIRLQTEFPTVITSNLFLDQLEKAYHPRFISRLGSKKNTIIELKWVDKRR